MKAMSLRPAAIQAWQDLVTAVRSPLDTRTYELVTIATASALRCSY
jgi:alkylhydroperoxidase/carboxymuconolactone decarboxylase family protein YurZ